MPVDSRSIAFVRVRRWSPERVAVATIMLVSQPNLTSVEILMSEWSRAFGWSLAPSDSTFVEARQKLAERFLTALWDLWQGLLLRLVEQVPVRHRTWVSVSGLPWMAPGHGLPTRPATSMNADGVGIPDEWPKSC